VPKTVAVLTAAFAGILLVVASGQNQRGTPDVLAAGPRATVAPRAPYSPEPILMSLVSTSLVPTSFDGAGSESAAEELTAVLRRYCVTCHNDQVRTGNLSLEGFDVAAPFEQWETAEKVVRKLRANMMPPPQMPRPAGDTLLMIAETLERTVDRWASANPNPGNRYFQRLNQPEYERAVHELLGLEVDASEFLPPDQRSANFDNIADAQLISPTLVTAYMNAASAISRLALGDASASPRQVTFRVSPHESQRDRVEGAPMGSRGGLSRVHTFPTDGEYIFRVGFAHTITGMLFGVTVPGEQIEISINGERIALLEVDQWMHEGEAMGVYMETEPIPVRAGPQRISAVFVKRLEGPEDNLTSPHEWTLSDRHIGEAGYGLELFPHLTSLTLTGPFSSTGVSETEIRKRILSCRPTSPAEERRCASEILGRLADRAFRGMGTPQDIAAILALHETTAAEQGFEAGIQVGLQAILAHPRFVFRFEPPAGPVRADGTYPISDMALASRLSFFLWNLPPDEELLKVAREGRLKNDRELERQIRRMLADPRSEALATRFAAQWLRLHDLDGVNPDAFWFPDFNEQLKRAMRRETELFFLSLIQEDRSYFDLLTADYTFLNEQLARHYGISGVVGDHFRRVTIENEHRRGLLGHGSVLTSTSFGNRTSIVNRGKWVLEVIMNTPPPPPPADVPPLEEGEAQDAGEVLTSKAQLQRHTSNPTCLGCHRIMDPIGLPLEMFDPTGRERHVERRGMGGMAIPLDTRGEFWDGTPVESPGDLRDVLVSFPVPLVRAFASNLMTYALGRRVEYSDQPAIRRITEDASKNDYRMSSFILGVVRSDAFRMMRPEVEPTTQADGARR
jgi:hypothetical protein